MSTSIPMLYTMKNAAYRLQVYVMSQIGPFRLLEQEFHGAWYSFP